jgi:hypothetical protein
MAAAINRPRRNTLIWHSLQTGKCFSGPRASHRYCACFCPYLESPKIRRLVFLLLLLLLLFFNLSFAPFLFFFASRRSSPSSQSRTSLLLQTLLSLPFSSLLFFFFFFFSFDFCLLIQASPIRSYCCFCCRDFVAVL